MSNIAPTTDQFLAEYPAFDELELSTIQLQLTISTRVLDAEAWGDYYDLAVGLDVAHHLTLMAINNDSITGGMQAAVGPVTGMSGAGMSTSFATTQPKNVSSEIWYSKTSYGQQFLYLRRNVMSLGIMAS